MVKNKMLPVKNYYVTMLRENKHHDTQSDVVLTYSKNKAIKIAKNFIKNRDASLYVRYEVDVTLFHRIYKRTWVKREYKESQITPEKAPAIFVFPKDQKNFVDILENGGKY